jgi:lysophospholipase L1-like esterase
VRVRPWSLRPAGLVAVGAAVAVAAAAGGPAAHDAAAASGTLGVTTVGSLVDGGGANYLDSSGPYALAGAATLTALSGYLRGGSATFKVRAVVYADSGGRPGALVAASSEVAIAAGQPAGWVSFPLPAGVAVGAGGYWLGYWYGSSGAGFFYASVAGSERYVPAAYSSTGSPPASYGSASTSASSYSLYATYTSSGGTAPPANTAPPTISGSAQQGQTLTAAPGTWTNSPTSYAYQWQDCDVSGAGCNAIGGATGSSYVLQASDVGDTVRVEVTAANAGGFSAPADSAPTAVVTASSGGGATFGETSVGTLTDSGAAGYLDVSGPYTLGSSGSLTTLTAYLAGGSVVSRLRGVVYVDAGGAPGALAGATPEVSVAAGRAGGWLDLPFASPLALPPGRYWLGYWYADSSSRHFYATAAGAERYARAVYSSTGSPPASFGSASSSSSSYSLYATYTASGGGGSPPANTAPPTISGMAQQGQTLTAAPGTWTNSPTSYAYQWQDCDASGAGCNAIGGATGATFTLRAADLGDTVRVAVTAMNGAGSATATSVATGAVSVATSASGVPSSIAALGDSLTRGYGAGGAGQDYPAESWSTGTDAAVEAIYLRLAGQNAAITGNAFNDAVSGSQMAATSSQAASAVSQGAAFVTVWSGTNDVCTTTTAQMTSVSSFSSSLQATLSELTSHLPGVRLLVVSIPDWYGFWQAYQGSAAAQSAWATYSNRCPDLLGASATSADRAAVQQRVSDLNAAIGSVCAQFSACSTDGGAVFRLWPTLPSGDLAFDAFHLSPAGEAAVAAALWPLLPWASGG